MLYIFCCTKKQEAPVVRVNQNFANVNTNTHGGNNRVGNDPDADIPKPKESNIDLVTTIERKDIEFREFYPEDRDEKFKFRFYCPICLRYFNSMLISQCCFNYLC